MVGKQQNINSQYQIPTNLTFSNSLEKQYVNNLMLINQPSDKNMMAQNNFSV